jgi:hypothetical protein
MGSTLTTTGYNKNASPMHSPTIIMEISRGENELLYCDRTPRQSRISKKAKINVAASLCTAE